MPRDGTSPQRSGHRVELPEVSAAPPIITLDRAVLIVPLKDTAIRRLPTRAKPAPGIGVFARTLNEPEKPGRVCPSPGG